MELMRPLLLFALAALLPHALGKSQQNYFGKNKVDILRNKIKSIAKLNETSPITSNVSELQSVFMNSACKECHYCMEQAIKAHKIHFHINLAGKVNVPNEIDNLLETFTYRNKRNSVVSNDEKNEKKVSKKSKTKKNKKNKSFSVIKYSDGNDNIYALKVKEPLVAQQNQSTALVTKCQVYRVKETSSCDSPDADKILHEMKRKVKKQVKEQEKTEAVQPIEKQDNLKNFTPLIIKHHVEDSQMFENFMPSVEEMY